MDSTRLTIWKLRLDLQQAIRDFFNQKGYLEVKTPQLVKSSGIDGHIKPIMTNGSFLPTSPELAMKKLLAMDCGPIFQICSAFRDEPVSKTHLPEFSMLEWYRPNCDYLELMNEVEDLFLSVLEKLLGRATVEYQERKIIFKKPWDRLRIPELFEKLNLRLDLKGTSPADGCYRNLLEYCRSKHKINEEDVSYDWDDLFHLIWLNDIEPHLPQDRPVFVYDYPAWQRSLSRVGQDSNGFFGKRFEVFAGGLELANAFDESLAADDYKSQFKHEWDRSPHSLKHPFDEELFESLKKKLPPTAGIALGVDRLLMLLSDTSDIRSTILLEPYWHP